MLHCAQFLPPNPPTSTAVPLLPSRRSRPPTPNSLVQRAMQPLGGDSYYFHFSNSVGGREVSVQHTPPPPSTSLPPSLPSFGPSPSPSYLHPLLRWPAEGKISIFICFFAGYVSLYPLLVPTPFSLLSATLLSPLPLWRFSLSFVLDFFFLFFLFLSPSYFHLPFLTAPRRRASARPTERE